MLSDTVMFPHWIFSLGATEIRVYEIPASIATLKPVKICVMKPSLVTYRNVSNIKVLTGDGYHLQNVIFNPCVHS
jgi:hypothetical protein